MPEDFYQAQAERVPSFLVHWARGCTMMIAYAAVEPAHLTPRGEMTIHAGPIVIKARLRKPRKGRVSNTNDHATAVAGHETMASFEAPADEPMAPLQPGANSDPDRGERTSSPTPRPPTMGGDDTNPSAGPKPPPGITVPGLVPVPAPGHPAPGHPALPPLASTPAEFQGWGPGPVQVGTNQTLENFLVELQHQRVLALHHLPEAGLYLEIFRVGRKGELEPFVP